MSDVHKKPRRARRILAVAAMAVGLSPAWGWAVEVEQRACEPAAMREAYQQFVNTRMRGVLTCLSQSGNLPGEIGFYYPDTLAAPLSRCAELWGTVEELETTLTVAVATECPAISPADAELPLLHGEVERNVCTQ